MTSRFAAVACAPVRRSSSCRTLGRCQPFPHQSPAQLRGHLHRGHEMPLALSFQKRDEFRGVTASAVCASSASTSQSCQSPISSCSFLSVSPTCFACSSPCAASCATWRAFFFVPRKSCRSRIQRLHLRCQPGKAVSATTPGGFLRARRVALVFHAPSSSSTRLSSFSARSLACACNPSASRCAGASATRPDRRPVVRRRLSAASPLDSRAHRALRIAAHVRPCPPHRIGRAPGQLLHQLSVHIQVPHRPCFAPDFFQ